MPYPMLCNQRQKFLTGYIMGLLFCCLAAPVGAQQAVQASVTPTSSANTSQSPHSATDAAPVSSQTLVAGRDYMVLTKRVPASSDRLDIVYFFWYNSPTSAKMDPLIRDWAKNHAPALVNFKPLPAVLEQGWGYGARIFFGLVDLGKEDQVGPRLLRAIDQGVVDYNNPKSLRDWLSDQGVSPSAFSQSINSGKVIAQTSWMPSLMRLYAIRNVPTIIMDGQFVFAAKPKEDPKDFLSRIELGAEALSQQKMIEMAKSREANHR